MITAAPATAVRAVFAAPMNLHAVPVNDHRINERWVEPQRIGHPVNPCLQVQSLVHRRRESSACSPQEEGLRHAPAELDVDLPRRFLRLDHVEGKRIEIGRDQSGFRPDPKRSPKFERWTKTVSEPVEGAVAGFRDQDIMDGSVVPNPGGRRRWSGDCEVLTLDVESVSEIVHRKGQGWHPLPAPPEPRQAAGNGHFGWLNIAIPGEEQRVPGGDAFTASCTWRVDPNPFGAHRTEKSCPPPGGDGSARRVCAHRIDDRLAESIERSEGLIDLT